MTNTNIKNLPEGHYFTEVGYSQSYPWVEVKRTAQTVTLAKVLVGPDPEWKPNILPGGFAGHCTNQNDQTWVFAGIDKANTVTIRKVKRHGGKDRDGNQRWAHKGVRFVEGCAREFYDYNF
jgi:hypothetical protein